MVVETVNETVRVFQTNNNNDELDATLTGISNIIDTAKLWVGFFILSYR